MNGGISKITVEIGGKIAASLGQSLRQAQAQVSTFGRNVNRTLNDAATAGSRGFKDLFRNDAFQGLAAGATSVGLAMGASVRTAANFQTQLTDIGKTANLSGEQLKGVSSQILALSSRDRTNLSVSELASGVQDLVAQGLELDAAIASMESLGRVATATNSNITDVTKTGFQLQNALKIKPTELKATFDALAFAGKQGAFELKDMAQFMPTIAAAAGTLGIEGKKGAISLAAMMQMVRKDAPDAGQAATRLTDAMLKMTAPATVKNFEKFGVDIQAVLKNAEKNGINPMEAALDKLQEVTGGDAFKLSEIFGDKEAKLALMSLMKYRKEYEALRDDAGGSAAAGTVDVDYEKSIQTFAGVMKSFSASAERLGVVMGNALLPTLTNLANAITPIVSGFADFAQKNPAIASTIVALGGAFVGLVAVSPFIASFISVLGSLKLAFAGMQLGATIAGWAGAIGPAMAAIGTFITGPIGIAILAVVGLGLAFKAAYDKIPAFRNVVNATMNKVKQIFLGAFTAIKGTIQGFITYFGGAWKVLTGILTLNPSRITEGAKQAFGGIKQIAGSWLGWMDTLWPGVKQGAAAAWNGLSSLASSAMGGVKGAFSSAIEGIKAGWNGLVSFSKSVWSAIMSGGLGQYINGLKSAFNGLITFYKGVWNTIVGIFTLDSAKAVAGVKQAFSGLDQLGAGIFNMAQGLGRLLVNGVTAGLQGIGAALQWLGSAIVSGLQSLGSAIVSGLAAIPGLVGSALNTLGSIASSVFSAIVQTARNYIQALVAAWRAVPGLIVSGLQALISGVRGIFDKIVSFILQTPARIASVGTAVINAILDGLKARAGALFGWIGGTWDRIKSMVGGGGDAPSAGRRVPGRAGGGRVTAGMPYVVGERRRELFIPNMDGGIVPRIARPVGAAAMAGLMAAQPVAAAAAPSININAPITINAAGGNPEEIRQHVMAAFADIQHEMESTYRVLLND